MCSKLYNFSMDFIIQGNVIISVLGFDLGGASIKYGIINENGNILANGKLKSSKEDIEIFINKLNDIKLMFQEKYDIVGVGIRFSGAVDNDTGIVGGFSAIPYIHGFNIKKDM